MPALPSTILWLERQNRQEFQALAPCYGGPHWGVSSYAPIMLADISGRLEAFFEQEELLPTRSFLHVTQAPQLVRRLRRLVEFQRRALAACWKAPLPLSYWVALRRALAVISSSPDLLSPLYSQIDGTGRDLKCFNTEKYFRG
jgi:hypothetical protein